MKTAAGNEQFPLIIRGAVNLAFRGYKALNLPLLFQCTHEEHGLVRPRNFAVLSDGTEIENPRLLQKQQQQLRRAQRRVARRKKFSKRWKKAVRTVQKIPRKVFNQRNDFQHKLSREITNNYSLIVVEDLKVNGLSRGLAFGCSTRRRMGGILRGSRTCLRSVRLGHNTRPCFRNGNPKARTEPSCANET
jgi:hypothetical protein